MRYDGKPTRRSFIAAAWIVATAAPLLLSVVFLFGCCVLPFHHVAHKLMPICHFAADILGGDAAGAGEQQTPVPAREKKETTSRLLAELTPVHRWAAPRPGAALAAPTSPAGFRSFISLGATRCDEDIGVHVLLATLLI